MYSKLLFLFLFFYFTTAIYAQKELTGYGKIYPTDEFHFDESFSEFYTNLMVAVDSKDVNFMYSCIHPEIQLNEHEVEKIGISYFKIKYDLNDSENEFWKIFKKILTLGGSRSDYDISFNFPSISSSDSYTEIFGQDVYEKIATPGNKSLGSAFLISIGCIQARVCHTGTCTAGIATQNEQLRQLFNPEKGVEGFVNFYKATNKELSVFARTNGVNDIHKLEVSDLVTDSLLVSQLIDIEHV